MAIRLHSNPGCIVGEGGLGTYMYRPGKERKGTDSLGRHAGGHTHFELCYIVCSRHMGRGKEATQQAGPGREARGRPA